MVQTDQNGKQHVLVEVGRKRLRGGGGRWASAAGIREGGKRTKATHAEGALQTSFTARDQALSMFGEPDTH